MHLNKHFRECSLCVEERVQRIVFGVSVFCQKNLMGTKLDKPLDGR